MLRSLCEHLLGIAKVNSIAIALCRNGSHNPSHTLPSSQLRGSCSRRMQSSRTFRLVAVALVTFVSAQLAAQSLGDVARQERARRAELRYHGPVLTNDDLRRDRILPATTPELQPPEAAFALPALANVTIPTAGASVDDYAGVSLGEYARALRQRRRERLAEAARLAATVVSAEQRPPLPANPHAPSQQLDGTQAAEPVRRRLGPRNVRVRQGESLWLLARRHLGDGRLWRKILRANPGITNPDFIRAGQVLSLPTDAVSA